jgi:mono/diheme cytochrome c family protein
MHRFSVGVFTALIIAFLGITNLALMAQTNPADAKKLKNPSKPTAESVAAGQKVFAKACSVCHGQSGKGDGAIVKSLKPEATKPSNLADDKWDHGSTDGEIFVVVRDGIAPKFEMKGQKGKLTDQDMWNLVNYIRSLNTKTKS